MCPTGRRSHSRSAARRHATKAATHSRGTKVGHLKECFGLFAPDPDSTLFTEVAAATADTYNDCGFDMIYLDALDGSDVLDPHRHGEFAWHYAGRFAFEVARRLRRPAVFEMSMFTHHLWCIRSRYAAWDHPNRSYKRFVDLHCAANEENRRMFLPGELGWWALKGWNGSQTEPTFADDIEYLLAKGLATDTGFALMGIDPRTAAATPALPRPGRAHPALGDAAPVRPGARGHQGPAPRTPCRVHARGRSRSGMGLPPGRVHNAPGRGDRRTHADVAGRQPSRPPTTRPCASSR